METLYNILVVSTCAFVADKMFKYILSMQQLKLMHWTFIPEIKGKSN